MRTPPEGTVISGTLRAKDLVPAFLDVLKEYAPDEARDTIEFYREIIDALEQGRTTNHLDESVLLDDLFDALDYISPPGYYFGAHPGDGSDFGFWPCEDTP